jgi:hypothetical protein
MLWLDDRLLQLAGPQVRGKVSGQGSGKGMCRKQQLAVTKCMMVYDS